MADHAQLAVYQAVILAGGLDSAVGAAVQPGGASLVQLRFESRQAPGSPKVQQQAQLACDDVREAPIVEALQQAVELVRSETFPAVPSSECRRCAFARACPAQALSGEVLP